MILTIQDQDMINNRFILENQVNNKLFRDKRFRTRKIRNITKYKEYKEDERSRKQSIGKFKQWGGQQESWEI